MSVIIVSNLFHVKHITMNITTYPGDDMYNSNNWGNKGMNIIKKGFSTNQKSDFKYC